MPTSSIGLVQYPKQCDETPRKRQRQRQRQGLNLVVLLVRLYAVVQENNEIALFTESTCKVSSLCLIYIR